MQAELRRATGADAEVIADVFLRARARMSYLPRLHTDDETRAFVRDVLLLRHEVWIAEVDERPVAFMVLGSEQLEHLYVAPDAQGRGVGGALLAHAKALRPAGFELWVFQKNEGARRFYQRHGLDLVEQTDGSTNEEKEPDARYAWRPRRS